MADQATFSLSDAGHIRIFNMETAKVWDRNAGAMGLISAVTSANAAITVPYTAAHKIGLISIPAALPNGKYYVAVYNVPFGSAADTDTPASVFRMVKETHYLAFESELQLVYK